MMPNLVAVEPDGNRVCYEFPRFLIRRIDYFRVRVCVLLPLSGIQAGRISRSGFLP